MIKKLLLNLFLVFFLTSGLFAQDDWFAGASTEINGQTRWGAAIGGGLLFGYDLDYRYAVGLKASYFNNLVTVSCVETDAIFRFYLPWDFFSFSLENKFYIQAEAGLIVFFEYGKSFPAFSGGLTLGWRFKFGEKWFLEPAIRCGYPHIWGVNVTAGMNFSIPIKKVNGGESG